MAMVRLRYTGLVAYSVSLTTMLTGLIFSVVITRRLSPEELGAWRYIGTLINYFIVPAWLFGFWITRMTARGLRPLATSLAITAPIMSASTALFILMASTFSEAIKFPETAFLIAAIEIPIIYLYTLYEASLNAVRPQTNYYAQLIQEVVKLPIGVLLVVLLRLGLIGALWSAIAGFAARALTLALLARGIGLGTPSKQLARLLITRSWLPLYASIPSNIIALDNIIVALSYGSAEPLGYAAAAFLLGSITAMSGTLSAGLYPRMLQKPSPTDIEESLKMVLMIAIPTAAGITIISAPLLNILRPDYVQAAAVMPILQLQGLVSIMLSVMDSVIAGEERADYDDEAGFRGLVKSRLFLIPTLNNLYAAAYLPALTLALIILKPTDPVAVLWVWITTGFTVSLALLLYKVKLARSRVPFKFPAKHVARYLAATLAMAAVLNLMRPTSLPNTLADALALTIPSVLVSAIAYFGPLYLIDGDFRKLVSQVLDAFGLKRQPPRTPS
jgi:O-antigen/teichoic acid export membrane protein